MLGRALAQALLEMGERSGRLEDYERELEAVVRALRAHHPLRECLFTRFYPRDLRRRCLDDLMERADLSEGLRAFLRLVLEHEAMSCLEEVLRRYREMVDQRTGRVRATMWVADDPPRKLLDRLRSLLEQATGRRVLLELRRDPGILGGAVVQVEDRIYDGSLRTQIRRMAEGLRRPWR